MMCGKMDELKVFKERCIKYNMMDVLMIPKCFKRTAVHPSYNLVVPEMSKSLLDHWLLFTLEHLEYF